MTSGDLSPDRIVRLGYAFRESKALLSAVELGVFTALAAGPLELETLRRKINIDARGARDFFDALVALGMLERDGEDRYANTAETDYYLDRNKPTYIGGEFVHFSTRVYPHWSLLTPALRSGAPQSETQQTGSYAAVYRDPEALENFVRGMTGGSLPSAKALAANFPWHRYRSVIDIGTAQGCLPVEIAAAHPHISAVGFDLPPIQPHFERYVAERGLARRVKFHAGDFFHDPFPPADVVVLGRILHNWDLPTKGMLLAKAYAALPDGGTAIVYERFIDDERRTGAAALLMSLNMLIMTTGGFDFSAADCIEWMRETGFRELRTEQLIGDQSMVVGIK
jgi:hypothetical protein